MNWKSKIVAAAAALTLIGSVSAAVTMTANAATTECADVTPAGTCASWTSGLGLALDVQGQVKAAGTPIIAYTPGTDPATDFEQAAITNGSVSIYPGIGPSAGAPASAFDIEYAPDGVPSGLCISVITGNAGQPAGLRECTGTLGRYNPYQAFVAYGGAGTTCDGSCVALQSVLNEGSDATVMYLTDLTSSIGRKGHRNDIVSEPQVTAGVFVPGQLWAA
ncbi:MAG: hypothetical protein ACRDPY_15190 [Streptosporangiaceae bacterium]